MRLATFTRENKTTAVPAQGDKESELRRQLDMLRGSFGPVQPGIPVPFLQRHHGALVLHVRRPLGIPTVHQLEQRVVVAVLRNQRC